MLPLSSSSSSSSILLPVLPLFFIFLIFLTNPAHASCHDPSPAFPRPTLTPTHPKLRHVFSKIENELATLLRRPGLATTSFSLSITTSHSTLFTQHHTAQVQNDSRPGSPIVTEKTYYRIASITKPFTVLGILREHARGSLHLDDSILQHLPILANSSSSSSSSSLPFKDITLRALASQLSGLPGDLLQSDLLNLLATVNRPPWTFGLPEKTAAELAQRHLPTCDEYAGFARACNASDLIDVLTRGQQQLPLFAPAQRTSYCNVGYELLGLVLAAVDVDHHEPRGGDGVGGGSYEAYIHRMLADLGVRDDGITFEKPKDQFGVIPRGGSLYWDVDMGVQNPTGGLFANTAGLSQFLRYVLTSYNGITPGALNWFHSSSFTSGTASTVGMPWEIYRRSLADYLPTSRPITFVTKSGSIPGYRSLIILLPEYDLGISILVAGVADLLLAIRETVTAELVPTIEAIAQERLAARYVGVYSASAKTGLNSSLTLTHSPATGLTLSKFISNGTDVLEGLPALLLEMNLDQYNPDNYLFHIVPTLLFVDEENKKGERWRMLPIPISRTARPGKKSIWDDFCIERWDPGTYAGRSVNELIFWTSGEGDGETVEVELPAFEVTLKKRKKDLTQGGKLALSREDRIDEDEVTLMDEL